MAWHASGTSAKKVQFRSTMLLITYGVLYTLLFSILPIYISLWILKFKSSHLDDCCCIFILKEKKTAENGILDSVQIIGLFIHFKSTIQISIIWSAIIVNDFQHKLFLKYKLLLVICIVEYFELQQYLRLYCCFIHILIKQYRYSLKFTLDHYGIQYLKQIMFV